MHLYSMPSPFEFLNSTISNSLIKVYKGHKESFFRHLKDSLPQRSVLAPLLFNMYNADILVNKSRQLIGADEIPLATQNFGITL